MLIVARFRRLRIILSVLASLCLVAITGAVAFAHPAPSVLHDYVISLTPQSVTVASYLRISPELAPAVYKQIDTDNDGKTSATEMKVWLQAHPSKLRLTLDGAEVKLVLHPPASLSKEDLLVSISQPVVLSYTSAAEKPLQGKHRIRLTYGDNYLTYDEYYISVAGDMVNDGRPAGVARPSYPATYQVIYQMPDAAEAQTKTQNLPPGELAPAPWSAGSQSTPTTQTAQTAQTAQTSQVPSALAPVSSPIPNSTSPNSSPGPIAQRLDLPNSWRVEIWGVLIMLVMALAVGALHALTPEHGKAMMATDSAGSRGRERYPVRPGGTLTSTRMIGVVALGVVLLLISNFVVPRALTPALDLACGVLVVVLGASLLAGRSRDLRTASDPYDEHIHRYPRARPDAHPRFETAPVAPANLSGAAVHAGTATVALASTTRLPVRATAGSRVARYDPRANGLRGHGTPGHDDQRDESLDQLDNHNGDRTQEQSRTYTQPISPSGKPKGLRALISTVVSSGLAPSPDAWAILLLAAGVGQFALGLSLVVSFTLGFAGVLIGTRVAQVKRRGALQRTQDGRSDAAPTWSRWLPLVSAAIVTLVGLFLFLSSLSMFWN